MGRDIIEVDRIQQAMARWGQRFLERVFTTRELELCVGRPASLAARFAAKEAVMKALGPQGLRWQEIEVLANPQDKPVLHLHGRAQHRTQEQGSHLDLSLSHSREYAIAFVMGWP